MPLKVPYASLADLLDFMVNPGMNNSEFEVHLYQNNHTPADSDTVADYTEATFSGYAAQNLGPFAAALEVDPRAIATAPALTFTNTSGAVGNMLYGYYVTDGDGNLLWAELDPSAPINMMTAGSVYVILPRFSIRSEF